jgi:hypothetical protein
MENADFPRRVPPRHRRPARNQAKVQRVALTATGGGKGDSLPICGSRVLAKIRIFRPYLSFAMPAMSRFNFWRFK